ncbi:MAG: type II toxin-antitoxin system VapB family antitoxin [bacterium]
MRTTINISDDLISEAMFLTNIKTKSILFQTALKNMIQCEKIKELKNYFGKVDLEIDINQMRER